MTSKSRVYPVTSNPGVKRDGTAFEGNYFTDSQWVRWQRGLARKIGGYIKMGKAPAVARGCDVFTRNGALYSHFGTNAGVYQAQGMLTNNTITAIVNRTPATFTSDDDYLWQFAQMYDAGSATTRIIAHAAPNLVNIDNDVTGKIYLGTINTAAALTAITASDVSGGMAVLHPYLFYFGSDGLLGWSVANQPSDLSGAGSGEGRVTGGKVLYGTQTRAGAGNAPAGLFWATDALIRAVFVGGTTVFNFDRIATSYSILSSQSVVEYDGIYYWPGVDRWFAYTGVIQEVPNNLSRNWFFDNLNLNQRQKVWGTKVPAYGEIWWHFPFGDSEECNKVIIFNVRENTWYDSDNSRSTGFPASIFPNPLMFDAEPAEDGTYGIWKHEYGVDKADGTDQLAIRSFFQTADFFSQPIDREVSPIDDLNLQMLRFEPDFVLSGDMTIKVLGRKYPQSTPEVKQTEIFDSTTEKLDIRQQARIMSLYFENNEMGGDFQQGKPLILIDAGDKRP
jgi:hypothetical protein